MNLKCSIHLIYKSMNFNSYFTIKRKKYQVFIRAIFIFFRKIILIFRACRKAPRQVNPRLILGFPLGETVNEVDWWGAVILTLLKNFKQTDSRPPRLPLRGGSAAQRRWRGPPWLPPSGFSCRAAAQRQSRRLALPTKRTEEVNYLRFISGFPSGGLFSPSCRPKAISAACCQRSWLMRGQLH